MKLSQMIMCWNRQSLVISLYAIHTSELSSLQFVQLRNKHGYDTATLFFQATKIWEKDRVQWATYIKQHLYNIILIHKHE